ncbi:MAG: DNA gyrase subunit A [Gammaproteobacteria bacterium]|nr:DNA gyrase subunit A [Gammaproteobacteria bacterium]
MAEIAREILSVNLEDEMKQSYLDYAMSVIVGRALPDVRDGLKPVHRRVLYAMQELGNDWNKAYKKSARVVGDVIGKYHPHGDTAVYDTIVRMAQDFSMRYMLIDGQGNFGSVDGDSPAAMRYTEIRMARLAHKLLEDIDKETVDFIENYDETETEPVVLPTRVPNLLVNGSAGIAVGMATNMAPHNLTEVINATLALLADPALDIPGLMEYLPGPDFPTAGIINGASGIREAYATGRGRIHVRATSHIEETDSGRQSIIVTELPYQVNKANLLIKIADLVREKKIESIASDGLRDESDKDGMRMVIELKRGEVPEVTLNKLYSMTQLQTVFGINMVALVDGRPRLLNLKEILQAFLKHRRDVVTRRTLYELRKARDRAHILEGLTVALANVDEIIALIKAAASPAEAREQLQQRRWDAGMVAALLGGEGASDSRPEGLTAEFGLHQDGYQLSAIQAQAILDLRLQKLTGLEQEKLTNEYKEIIENIRYLLKVLAEPDVMTGVIRDELIEVRDQFGDDRRTVILDQHLNLSMEDMIAEEDVVVTLSHAGYAKMQSLDRYQAQHRGGRGRSATRMKDEDFIERLWVTNTHDTLLCFTSAGKVYWIKVYELPNASHASRGKPFVNLLPLDQDEQVNAVLPVRDFPDDQFVVFATANGTVKKTPLSDYSRPRANGIWAISLDDDDRLVNVALTGGSMDIMLFANSGKCVRFNERAVRSMGRTARGVRGMRLQPDQQVMSMQIVAAEVDASVMLATANGYGKRTPISEFPLHGRGGQGVIAIQTSARNGDLVGAILAGDDDDVMLISNSGTLVRTPAAEISVLGRNTQGVRVIRLDENEQLVGLAQVQAVEDDD